MAGKVTQYRNLLEICGPTLRELYNQVPFSGDDTPQNHITFMREPLHGYIEVVEFEGPPKLTLEVGLAGRGQICPKKFGHSRNLAGRPPKIWVNPFGLPTDLWRQFSGVLNLMRRSARDFRPCDCHVLPNIRPNATHALAKSQGFT